MLQRSLALLVLCLVILGFPSMASRSRAQLPPPPPDAGLYPEPVDVPRYFPPATVTDNAMVSAAHPLAAKIGVDILKAGGNAIDAMVAVQFALNVVEPQSSGIGGGCFIMFYDAKEKKTFCIDGREECPEELQREDFLDADGKVKKDELTGGLPVGAPGAVAAMWLAHERWGKLPIARVLEPAIKLAEEGIGITPRLRTMIAVNRTRFLKFPSSKAVFLKPDGSVPELGEVFKQPDLGRTFRLLAKEGPKVFYQGEIARDTVRTVRGAAFHPGKLCMDDLKNYRPVYREPVQFTYRGHQLVSVPPPSSGGITVGLILGILEKSDFAKHKAGTLDEIELLARASAAAFADRNAYLGDQDWSPALDMRALLKPEHVRGRLDVALLNEAGNTLRPGPKPLKEASEGTTTPRDDPTPNPHEGDNTTHYSIVDAERNVVACTTTIEHGMGCGLVVEGRGFLLNNQLTDFDLAKASGPNVLDSSRQTRRTAFFSPLPQRGRGAGGEGGEAAQGVSPSPQPSPPKGRGRHDELLGGKRPRSSMTPVIVFKDGKPCITVGSPGGSQIINIVAQVLVNVLDHEMDMQQAINAPRLSSQNKPLQLEGHYAKRAELVAALKKAGWRVQESKTGYEAWGGAHGIRIRPDGKLEGGADPRREGAVRGY
jgi:gamma-glutamyltranspeptidase/glutathione hydrolase